MPFVVSRYLALLFALGLAIGETIISWGHWQFAPLWIIDYLVAILLLSAFYRTRNGQQVYTLVAAWAFSAGVFYMDLFVNLDPHLPAHLRPGYVVMALIVLVLVLSLIGFFSALVASRAQSS
jgi:cytochrome b